jgi:16S rRNA processing protein RimM
MVLVGRIARPHGRFGHVIVNPETDFPDDRFAPGAVLHTRRLGRDATLTVTAMRMHQGRPIVALQGVDTMNEAEEMAGLELRVPTTELRHLPQGSYYQHALIGCEVVTVDGRVLGPVRTVEGQAEGTRLVVGAGREEIHIPLAHDICVDIDVAQRRITIKPPDGLLDLNT